MISISVEPRPGDGPVRPGTLRRVDTPGSESHPDDAPDASVPTPSTPPVAAWYVDPARRHQYRYWDGTAWTGNVATNGITSWDPPYTDRPRDTVPVPPTIPSPRSTPAVPPVAPPPDAADAIPQSAPWSGGPVPVRRTTTIATVLGWTLAITSGAMLTRVAAAIYRIVVVHIAQAWDETKDPAPIIKQLQASDEFLDVTAFLLFVAWVAIFIMLVVWMHRSARNARDLGRWDNGLNPGWSIGGWFLPFANWYIPATLMQSIWRGAEAEPPVRFLRRRSAAIGLWWITYLIGAFTMFASFGPTTNDASSAQELYNCDTATIVACVLLIVSSLVLRGNVLAIQRRMRALTNDAL